MLEYVLILEENKKQKIELAKKLSKKRKVQKRKTIREILGFSSNIKISKRSKQDLSQSKAEIEKRKSPHINGYKHNSALDRTTEDEINNSLKMSDTRLPNLSLNESKIVSHFYGKTGHSKISNNKHSFLNNANTDYATTDKENSNLSTVAIGDISESHGKKNLNCIKKNLLS